MPKKVEVSIDELINSRKDISDDDGVLYKAHVAPRSWNEEERSAVFIMSAETEDSYRDVVIQSGIDTKSRFESNPVALFGHKSWSTPIGSWSDLKRINGSPKRTEGKVLFTKEGVDEDADKVARHVSGGTLRASSIGFMPKAAERILDDKGEWTYGYKYLEVELYECSIVTVPAVREALIRGAGLSMKGIVSPEVIEEFLEHLKANPGLAKMINRDLYEGVYREITGNKLSIEAPAWLGETRELVDRLERAAQLIVEKSDDVEIIEHTVQDPVIDEVAKELEDSVEIVLKDIAPKIDELPEDQVERKGALIKLLDGIRGLFKAAPEPEKKEPVIEPVKADPEIQKALKAQFEEIAARNQIAA
jgi:HK97 family phage prohead protease